MNATVLQNMEDKFLAGADLGDFVHNGAADDAAIDWAVSAMADNYDGTPEEWEAEWGGYDPVTVLRHLVELYIDQTAMLAA